MDTFLRNWIFHISISVPVEAGDPPPEDYELDIIASVRAFDGDRVFDPHMVGQSSTVSSWLLRTGSIPTPD